MYSRTVTMTKREQADYPCALRWLLARGDDRITCDITVTPDRRILVGFFPHGNPARSVVASFDQTTEAMERHAQIVRQLRESGWSVVDRLLEDDEYALRRSA